MRYVKELESAAERIGVGRIASISGRYYAMDRDKRWERTRQSFAVMTGAATPSAREAGSLLQQSYERGVTDEFIEPTVIVDAEGQPIGPIRADDTVICFNFRADRVRQISRALALADFDGFERHPTPTVDYTCMTVYDATFPFPVAFSQQSLRRNLGEVLGDFGITNLRSPRRRNTRTSPTSSTAGEERPYAGEDRLLIPSPKVATYDLQPAMSAPAIADALVQDVGESRHHVYVCNFANADMVGHTGKLDAAISAVETLDACLGRIVPAIRGAGGRILITADHGNCEQMWDDELDSPHTAHTSNPVPFILIDDGARMPLREGGALCDVAPTLLALLGVQQPKEMTGLDLRRL